MQVANAAHLLPPSASYGALSWRPLLLLQGLPDGGPLGKPAEIALRLLSLVVAARSEAGFLHWVPQR